MAETYLLLDPFQNIVNVHWKKKKDDTGGEIEVPKDCKHMPYSWGLSYDVVMRQHNPLTGETLWTPGDPIFTVWAESWDWWEYMKCENVPGAEWAGAPPPKGELCAAHAFIYILMPTNSEFPSCRMSDGGCVGIYPDIITHPECFVGTDGNATRPPQEGVGIKL